MKERTQRITLVVFGIALLTLVLSVKVAYGQDFSELLKQHKQELQAAYPPTTPPPTQAVVIVVPPTDTFSRNDTPQTDSFTKVVHSYMDAQAAGAQAKAIQDALGNK